MLVLNCLLLFFAFNFHLKEYQRNVSVQSVLTKEALKESRFAIKEAKEKLTEGNATRKKRKLNGDHKSQYLKDNERSALFSINRQDSITTKGNAKDYGLLNINSRRKRTVSESLPRVNFSSDVCGPILGSCEFAKHKDVWLCSCDSQCDLFGHCCYDFVEYDTTKEKKNSSTYQFKCHSKLLSSVVNNRIESSQDTEFGFLVIESCPDGYENQSAVTMCVNGDALVVGSYVISNENLVFRNKICAMCNGFRKYNYFNARIILPEFHFDIDDLPTEQNGTSFDRFKRFSEYVINEGTLIYTVEPPNPESLRGCLIKMVDINTNNDSLCQSYTNPVLVVENKWEDRVFLRNMYCVDQSDTKYKTTMCTSFEMIEEENMRDPTNVFLMSVMFRFTNDETSNECAVWSKEVADEGKCGNLDLYTNVRKDMEISWTANNNLSTEMLERIAHFTPWLFSIADETLSDLLHFSIQEEGYIVNVRLALKFVKTSFLHEINEFMASIQSREVSLVLNDNANHQLAELELQSGFQNISVTKRYNNRFPSYKMSFSSANINIPIRPLFAMSKQVRVVSRYENSYLVIDSVQTVNIVESKNYSVPDIVTYSCFSLSIVFLIILIFIQRRRNLLNNISSINIENLSISLLLADILFVSGTRATDNTMVCYMIGCGLHYLWLSFFTFITISVYYVSLSLGRLKDNRQDSSTWLIKQRVKVSAVGILVPIPFVVTLVCLDVSGPRMWSSGYRETVCFPDRYPANLVFFTGPIALSLVVNLACLVRIICRVCTIRMETIHVRKLSLYKESIIYLRMVVVSGVLWVFGFLASLYKEEWISYVFTFFCALHGFFISISVLTTSRIKSKSSCEQKQTQSKAKQRIPSSTTSV